MCDDIQTGVKTGSQNFVAVVILLINTRQTKTKRFTKGVTLHTTGQETGKDSAKEIHLFSSSGYKCILGHVCHCCIYFMKLAKCTRHTQVTSETAYLI